MEQLAFRGATAFFRFRLLPNQLEMLGKNKSSRAQLIILILFTRLVQQSQEFYPVSGAVGKDAYHPG